MMRKVKRLLCGALAALLIFGGALAEEGVADAEAQAAIEAQQRAEQEAREQAEREARERAEQEAREQAEREAREKAEQEAKEKAEREAKEKAEREAKEKAEREAKEKAAQEAAPKQEQATKAENPKEDKQEEKPAVKEEKQEEKPVVKEEKQEEKPAVKEEKQEEKPVVKEEKPAVIEDKQEEKPVVKEDKPEEAPEEKPAEKPAEASNDTPERAPEPFPEDQPDEAPAEKEIASDAAEEATEESPEESPEPSEEDMTDAPVDVPEDAPAAVPEDIPAAASEEEIPAVIEEAVEAVEAFAADESAQSRIDAQAAPPAGGTASPEPIALPETLATEVASAPAEIALVPEASKGVTGKDGVYQIATGKKAADATLSFPLNYAGACTGYKVSIVDAQGNVVYSGAQTEQAFVLDLSAYQTGSYMLVVEAVSGDAVVAWGQYSFALASGGGFPGGGFPGRGGSGGAPDGAADEVEQGFQVTPGEALAGSHIAGTKDLQLYGTVPLTLPDGAMTELILGDASLGIVLDGGRECFTAAIDGDKLTLTADGGGVWSFNGLALRILSDSGIETLVLENREGARDIATGQPLAGDVYARLCAAGVASSAYDYQVSDEGTRVFVDGQGYRVDESGAMIPMEGDGYAETMADAAAGAA